MKTPYKLTCYLVGGAVRDMLMGIEPKDKDYVVVGSTPEEMLSLGFQQVGADFPVFLHPETNEEYALARKEKKVGAGYLGFECDFDPEVTIEEDLSRRDLTINAIAYDEETGQYIDPFNGALDIKDRVLRHTSDAFSEDPVRVLRLARFYARYDGFFIHPDTSLMCKDIVKSDDFKNINRDRIWKEVYKTMSETSGSDFFCILDNFGVMNVEPYRTLFANMDKLRLRAFESHLNANMRLAICMDRTLKHIFPTCIELELHKMLGFKEKVETCFPTWGGLPDDEEMIEFVLKNGIHHNNEFSGQMILMMVILNDKKMVNVPGRFYEVLRIVENTKIVVPPSIKPSDIKKFVRETYMRVLNSLLDQ